MDRTFRFRSTDSVREDFEQVGPNLFIADDLFCYPPERSRKLAQALRARDIAAAVEVPRRLGFGITGNFIVDPDWGEADFERLWGFTILTPLPGTSLYEESRGRSLWAYLRQVRPTQIPFLLKVPASPDGRSTREPTSPKHSPPGPHRERRRQWRLAPPEHRFGAKKTDFPARNCLRSFAPCL